MQAVPLPVPLPEGSFPLFFPGKGRAGPEAGPGSPPLNQRFTGCSRDPQRGPGVAGISWSACLVEFSWSSYRGGEGPVTLSPNAMAVRPSQGS